MKKGEGGRGVSFHEGTSREFIFCQDQGVE